MGTDTQGNTSFRVHSKNWITMRTVFIIAAICIAYAAAETAVEQEDVVPETSLAQSEESYGILKRHAQRIRFSVCRYRAKKCHKHAAKSTKHLKAAAAKHAAAAKNRGKVAKAHGKVAHKAAKRAGAHARASHHHSRASHHHSRKAKYHHKKAGGWWHFWKRAHRRAAKNAKARAKGHKRAAHAHAKIAKAHAKKAKAHGKAAKKHGAKARAHAHISKKLMACIRSKHKKCGLAFMKCMGRGKVKRRRHYRTRRL